MTDRSCLAIILAAGQGTRFKSKKSKVVHPIANRPIVAHIAESAAAAGADQVAVIVGPAGGDVEAAARLGYSNVVAFVQNQRLGTAHAVLSARTALEAAKGDVVVLLGDAPLVTAETIGKVRKAVADGADMAVLGFHIEDPKGYGRLLEHEGELIAIREERDASEAERQVTFCNSGLMAFAAEHVPALLDRIGNDNAQSEYYLTDAVEVFRDAGLIVKAVEGPATEMLGINDRVQLSECERAFQDRKRVEAMRNGVTLIAPETVYFSYDTHIAADVEVEPHVVFGPGVHIEADVSIRAFSHLEGCHVAAGAKVGPYARLRPETQVGEDAHIGNFVELKKTKLAAGAKVNHLSYIGDAEVGEKTNIGAGTITCNYDGYTKSKTEIGARAFIGSNSALVAPVVISEDAYVASGSVITDPVPPGELAIARGRQANKPGWVERFREGKSKLK